jgi:hypothetical protein
MQNRVIMLVDFDYFFAQCEELRDPSLKDKPVVVGVYSGRTERAVPLAPATISPVSWVSNLACPCS